MFISRLLTMLGLPHVPYHGAMSKITLNGRELEIYVCWAREFKRSSESKIALDTYAEFRAVEPVALLREMGLAREPECSLLTS